MTSPIDQVGPPATLPTTYDPSAAKVNSSGEGKATSMLDPEAFLQLLVAQLKYQDPTNPTDTSQFMNQTAMLSQVQTMNTMSDTLTSLMTAQQTASATSMIGKAISFVDPSGKQASGIVDGVSFSKGAATLHVGNYGVPLSGVLAVADPVALGGGQTGDGTDGTPGVGDGTGTDGTTGSDTTGGTDPTAGSSDTTNDVPAAPDAAPPAPDAPPGATTPDTPTTRPDTISA